MNFESILAMAVQDPQFSRDYVESVRNWSEFPAFIKNLPRADYRNDTHAPIRGYVLQGEHVQLVFNENDEEVLFVPHRHAQSFGIVLQGECKLMIAGHESHYKAGDVYHVPGGVEHFAWQSANYKDIVIFNEPGRVAIQSISK